MPVKLPVTDPTTADILKILTQQSPTIHAYREGNRFGMVIGGLVLLGGFAMFVMGLSGSVEWILEAGSLKARLANASPGAIFSLIGLFVMLKYRPKVKMNIELNVTRQYEPGTSNYVSENTQVKYQSSSSSPITSR